MYNISTTYRRGNDMNFKNADMDMLHGPLTKKLLLFTLPIALSSILQQLFNAADTAVSAISEIKMRSRRLEPTRKLLR